jgi:hypothetical protein
LFAVFCLLPLGRAAAPAEVVPGLRYFRIHSLEKSAVELADALNQPAALVLDLRYVADESGAAQAINVLNSQPAKPKLYILVSPETPQAVAEVIAKTSTPLVIIGIQESRPKPEVLVDQSAASDRGAYVALENGTSLTALISGKIEKERFDEAELVKEFKNGNHDAHPPEGNADGAKVPNRLTDRVLQRAVHLHQALQALKSN